MRGQGGIDAIAPAANGESRAADADAAEADGDGGADGEASQAASNIREIVAAFDDNGGESKSIFASRIKEALNELYGDGGACPIRCSRR